ncbi:hypothetical protein Tco_0038674 [Tanacetum coccineum]
MIYEITTSALVQRKTNCPGHTNCGEDGLSAMDTRLGHLFMLESYTNTMCMKSWGRLNYACAPIDIRDNRELEDNMVIVILNLQGEGDVLHTGGLRKVMWLISRVRVMWARFLRNSKFHGILEWRWRWNWEEELIRALKLLRVVSDGCARGAVAQGLHSKRATFY